MTLPQCNICLGAKAICMTCGLPVHDGKCANGHEEGVPCPCIEEDRREAALDSIPWRKARKVRLLVLSPSGYETAELCIRKWWLEKVRRLPSMSSLQGKVFGTVLHSVIDRFLSADELGRTNGQQTDLFPEGWTKARDRWKPSQIDGEVTPGEADTIKRLVTAAIDQGVLERLPDRVIETGFDKELMQIGDTKVRIKGFIDMAEPGGIQDHKSVKKMSYAKSPAKLKENMQMMIYAKILLMDLAEAGFPLPEKVSLRHNQFCKDPDDLRVKKTEAFVSPEEVESFWLRVQDLTKEMARYRDKANTWNDLPNPAKGSNACNAYGGCAFQSICNGKESEEMYEKRLASYGDVGIVVPATEINTETPTERNTQMGLADLLRNGNVLGPTPSASAINPPAATPAPVAATTPAPVTTNGDFDTLVVPWAQANCTACKGLGFNTNANPCNICQIKCPVDLKPHLFKITDTKDGHCKWELIADPTICGVSPMKHNAGEQVKATEKVEAPAPLPVAEEAVQTVTLGTPAVIVGDAPKRRGRPAKGTVTATGTNTGTAVLNPPTNATGDGFILVIGANITRGVGDNVIFLLDHFADLREQAEKESKVSYYDQDAFKRRDTMAKNAKVLADGFGDAFVVVDLANATPDIKSFVEAIRPYAAMEIVGGV